MEKLIELLNEYEYSKELKEVPEEEKDLFVQKIFWHESYGVLNSYGCEDYEILKRKFCYMYAISKEYGFIKWLVENDKIDLEAQAMQYAKSDLSKFFAEWKDKNGMSDDYAMLLMLLSISSSPIEDLISYLR